MKAKAEHIPVYSLHNFTKSESVSQLFQIEVFDANRHFSVQYPHRHDFFEVLYLSKGSGFHIIDENKYEIKPHSMFFMSPGQAHKIEFSSDIEGFIFIFTAEFYLINQSNQNRLIEFPFFFTIRQDNPPLLLNEQNNVLFLERLFKEGIAEVQKEDDCSIDLLRSILDLILTWSSTHFRKDENTINKGKGHLIVKKFFQLIEENFHKNLTISEYASKLAITPNHLTQTVTNLTGRTSSQMINAKQVLEIKRLLLHTNLGVSEIAGLLNFPDQSYFSKYFKREVGVSPLQYRTKSLL